MVNGGARRFIAVIANRRQDGEDVASLELLFSVGGNRSLRAFSHKTP